MKKYLSFLPVILAVFILSGCVGDSNEPTDPSTSPIASSTSGVSAAQLLKILNTGAQLLENINTGFLAAAPTVETVLTMFHNAGDAQLLANGADKDAVVTAALSTLLSNVKTAVASSSTGTAQQAAVSAAVAPSVTASIVAPISAANP